MADVRKLKDRFVAADRALRAATAGIEEIRGELQRLKDECAAVETAPLPPDETVAVIDRLLDTWSRVGAHSFISVDAIAVAVARGQMPGFELHHGATIGQVVGLLAPLLRGHLRAAMVEAVEQYYEAHPPGLPAAERAQKLADLDRQIGAIEQHEVEALQLAAAAGMEIDYRPDTAPEALLGLR